MIEDAEEFARLSSRILAGCGFEVHVARSRRAGGSTRLGVHDFDLVLIDVALPGMDGFEVLPELRTFTDSHVVIVTAHDSEVEKVIGFRLGADDHVTKPYSPVERRHASAPYAAAPVRRGPIPSAGPGRSSWTSPVVRRAWRAPLALTRTEFDLLSALTAAPGRVRSRRELQEDVWGDGYGDLRVVDVHIANLRRKLRSALDAPPPIVTVRGTGYRLETAP